MFKIVSTILNQPVWTWIGKIFCQFQTTNKAAFIISVFACDIQTQALQKDKSIGPLVYNHTVFHSSDAQDKLHELPSFLCDLKC